MRKQFVRTLQKILYSDDNTVLLLGDIGVFAFREELKNISNRVYNIGILEQSTVSLAAGLSHSGLIPFFHTISPFMVERALEQIKIDFAYQQLTGNFISIGNSYDYAALGCTHHCPGDVQTLLSIPNVKIFSPGTGLEFDYLLNRHYTKGVNYYRLSEYENIDSYLDDKPTIVKTGKEATIICFGNVLTNVVKACKNLNVTIIYYHTIFPFNSLPLIEVFNKKIICVEPFYQGSTTHLITTALVNKEMQLYNIGVPRQFLTNYGNKDQHDKFLGLDIDSLYKKITNILRS